MLQFTQYKVTLTRRITDCTGTFKTVVKAEITPQIVDDGDYVYVIPANSLISPMKITELKLEWSGSRLSSINASAEDRTAQTILAAAQGIGKVAGTIIGGAVGAGGAEEGCTDEAVAALVSIKQATGDVKKHSKEIDKLTPDLSRLKAALIIAPDDKGRKDELAELVRKIDAETILLDDARERLKKAEQFLTYTDTVIWPTRSNEFASPKPFEVPLSVFPKWYDLPRQQGDTTDQIYEARRKSTYQGLAKKMAVWLFIERVGSYGVAPVNGTPGSQDGGTAQDGLRFRVPANGLLVVCQEVACKSTDSDHLVTTHAGAVQQLGHIFFAPFSSPPFTNAAFGATFDDLGRPKTMTIGRKNASAEAIANLVKDLGAEGATLYGALNKTPAEKAAQELAALEAEKKIVDARAALDPNSSAKQLAALEMDKKLADARRALELSPTFELARLTAIAQAQRQYQEEIAKLQSDPNQAARDQQAAFAAEAAALEAEAKSIEAKLRVRDAKALLGE